MLIFCIQKYFFHSRISFFKDIYFLKKLEIEKNDTSLMSPNERTIRLNFKMDNFKGRMLIFCMQNYLFYSEISIYSDRRFLKTRKNDTSSKRPNKETIRKASKTDNFEFRMLILFQAKMLFHSGISFNSNIHFLKKLGISDRQKVIFFLFFGQIHI